MGSENEVRLKIPAEGLTFEVPGLCSATNWDPLTSEAGEWENGEAGDPPVDSSSRSASSTS